MSLLESIAGPRDLRGLTDDQLALLASEIRDLWSRRAPGPAATSAPTSGVVELTLAIHRVFDSPRDRVVFDTGHQAYVHKMLTGRAARVRRPAPGGRPQRLPEPGRVRARHRRELPRLDRAELRRRAGQGLRDPRRGPARGRGHRRRRAHRRDGLGGAQQHRDRQGQPAGDRRQRQRPLLHARPSAAWPPRSPRCAPTRATSTCSTWSSGGSTPSPASAPRRTTPCTR